MQESLNGKIVRIAERNSPVLDYLNVICIFYNKAVNYYNYYPPTLSAVKIRNVLPGKWENLCD